jgi:ketosteroid isomerase-like protein
LRTIDAAAAVVVLMLIGASVALAGPLETARQQEQKFDSAILACTPSSATELYEDDAVAIYPGADDIARGKDAIGKLLKDFSAAFCPNDSRKAALKDVSFAASPLGADYLVLIRVIEATDKNGDHALVRATKVIHHIGGKWQYVVDHTSVGLNPAPSGSSQ